MTKRFDSLLSWLLVVAIVVVGANAWFAFRAESMLAESESWVVHTWRAINMVERTLNAVEAMETGARGYLLSDDPTYLDSYHAGLRVLPADIQRFKELTADNARQQARAEELRRAVQARIDLLATQIALQNSGHRDLAMSQVRGGVGRAQMQQLRQTVDAMQKEETAMLATRREESTRAREEARATVLLASVLDLVLLLSSLWLLARERRLRAEAAETAERLARLQQISDAALSQLSLETMHLEMLNRLKRVVRADAAAIYGYSPDGLQMTPQQPAGPHVSIEAAIGIDLSHGTVLQLRPDGPIARAVESASVVKLTGDAVKELPTGEFSHSMRTLLILPLKVRETVIGLILIGHLREDAFSAADEDLLVIAADRIALAIDRAGLLEQETAARKSAEAAEAEVRLLNADLEARVQRRTEELETTNRELEAFSYSVSHDLRAPLRSVDGFSVALAEDYGALLQGDGQHYLTRIRVGVQRMGGLIDALLQLSRITRADLTTETVDLSALAADVAEDVRQAYPGRNLNFSIEPNLQAHGDAKLLRVVFENMFGNAAKFTGKIPEAHIDFGWSNDQQAYFIRDNGAGFDQQYAGKLFVAFQRLHGDKDFQGSGIGLATVARVIRRHHGDIRAEGSIGHGATFWFTLN
jgi:signal transduction histidine kinase/CHASE3 domain sensor protein